MGSDYTTHVTAFHSPVLKCLCQNKINGNSFVTGVGEERSTRRWIFMVLKCLLLSIGNAQLPSLNIFLQCCFQKMLKEKKNMVFSFTPFLGHKTSLNKNSQSRFLQSSSPVVQGLVCDYCVHLPLFFFLKSIDLRSIQTFRWLHRYIASSVIDWSLHIVNVSVCQHYSKQFMTEV